MQLTFGFYYAASTKNMIQEHIDIDHIAALCRIALTDQERETITEQLDTMLAYLKQLKEVNIENVIPMLHASDICNVLRADQPGENFPAKVALSNAPEQKNNQIVVPRIVE
jgi:aspartyl-tRNA(Asn)/glutamyl-tRNA(Gln) amidotransferase subunit C